MTDSIKIREPTWAEGIEEVAEVGGDERYGIKEWTDEQVEYRRALRESNLGISQAVGIPGDTGRIFELARLSVPQSCARLWGVQWDSELAPEPGSFLGRERGDTQRSRVQLKWGAGGVQHFAEADYRTGGRVQLFGSYISVAIRVEAGAVAVNTTATVRASISETDGSRPTDALYFTEYVGDVAPLTTSPVHPIPPFAVSLQQSMTNALFAGTSSVRNYQMLDRGGNIVQVYLNAFTLIDGLVLPLIGSAVKFQWQNTDAAQTQTGAALIFGLNV